MIDGMRASLQLRRWAMVALSLSVDSGADCDRICALQACMESFRAAAIESVVLEMDISVSITGNSNIITLDHVKAIS